MTSTPARTFTITSPAPRHYRNQRPTVATHILANEVPGVVVGSACERVFGLASTGGLAIDAEPRPVTCDSCNAGRPALRTARAFR